MADIQKAFNLHNEGKLNEAEKIYMEFLEENPKQPDVSNLLGLIYLQKKQLEKAEHCFIDAVMGFPCAEFYQNLGLVYYNKKDYPKSMECFSKAINFEKNNVDFIRNFAKMAKQSGQTEYAIDFYKKSLEIEPDDEVGLNNLGLLYEQLHDYKQAKTLYQQSLKVRKNFEALHNLGVLYRTERNFDESIKCLSNALKLKPSNNETMISLGMSYLSKKDLKNGFKYYKYMKPEIRAKYKNPWNGDKHTESTILVFYYAGYGDHIMFSRYLPFLKDYFKEIKLLVPPSLRSIFAQNFPFVKIVEADEKDYDFSASIMELHFLMRIDFEHIPFASGYLKSDIEIEQKYKKEYFQTNKKKIGLFWQGNPKVFPNRSIKLKELSKLFDLNDYEFFSFEKDDKHNQINDFPNLKDLGATFKNFSDTAGALKNLDILITIDSSIAHLSGALGVKTYLLLPYGSEWRWFKDEETTPWYDSIRIFKQKQHWDWTPVVLDIFDVLKNSD
ncbi:MAG: tetratricopeptide repeat protein [Clostridium sp.]|nr:tetratricopeptide repeat protein [Clostridium sp.]